MNVGQYCKRSVVAIGNRTTILQAAKLMRERRVGFLVVYKEGDLLRKPVGVLTDRDIVVQVTAPEVSPHLLTVGDVMTRQPMTANDTDPLAEIVRAMRQAGFRRVPVVDVRGALKGVITLDDAIDLVSGLLSGISKPAQVEPGQELRARTH